MKQYIIVGSNNFWYTTTPLVSQGGLALEIDDVKKGIIANQYDDDSDPETLFAYPLFSSSPIRFKF